MMTAMYHDSARTSHALPDATSSFALLPAVTVWPCQLGWHEAHETAWNCFWFGQSTQLNTDDGWQRNRNDNAEQNYEGNQVNHNDYRRAALLDVLPEEPRQEDVLLVNSATSGACDLLCADATKADCVAFDAEWVPDWTSGSDNPISVLQLAFPASRRVYVIQLAALQMQLPPAVMMMMVNPEVTKVGFACDQHDLDKLRRSRIAVTEGSVVDVQEQCAATLGISATSKRLSLKKASSGLLGFQMHKDKRLTCSDWSREKLSPEQVRYAALDAWVALRLYMRLYTTRLSAPLCTDQVWRQVGVQCMP